MRRIYLLLSVVLLCSISKISVGQNDQFIVGGCQLNKIAVINRTGEILWSAPVSNSNCNDVQITKEGNILYSNGVGAYLINRDKELIWSHMAKSNEEIYSATQQKNGEYVLTFSGHPARIIELSKSGDIIKEIKFETGVKSIHSQFRQVSKLDNGNYIVPIIGKGNILELDENGSELRSIYVGGNPFQVNIISKKEWLVAGGDGSFIALINPKSETVTRKIEEADIKDCKLLFVGEGHILKNGNIIFANWSGHDTREIPQPIVAEIDNENKMVWHLNKSKSLNMISSICPIAKKHHF